MLRQQEDLSEAPLVSDTPPSSSSGSNLRRHNSNASAMFTFNTNAAMARLQQVRPDLTRYCDVKVRQYLDKIAGYSSFHQPLVLLLLFEGHYSFFTLEVARNPAALLMSAIQDICNHISKHPQVARQLLQLMIYRLDLASAIDKFAFTALLSAPQDTALVVLAWAKELPEGVWEEGRPDPARWLSQQIKQQCRAAAAG